MLAAATLGGGCGSTGLAFLALFALSWVFGRPRNAPATAAAGPFEVRRVSVAFDWTARRELQAALDRLASTLPLEGSEGRRAGARAVALELASRIAAARYATFQALRVAEHEAEPRFSQLGVDLAARYQHERGAVPEGLKARSDEGEGLVVVSLIVATDAWMAPLPPRMDRHALHAALASLAAIASPTVLGLEVIWSPAVEQDRMSSLELEALYPELQRLDADAALGRVACGYCSAPYPAELGRCPACGAPR